MHFSHTDSTRLVVGPLHAGERIDRFLAAATPLSRRKSRVFLQEGLVSRNGKELKVAGRLLQFGDVIDVRLSPEEVGVPATPDLPDIEIVHQDSWILAVDKPSGRLSQPAERRQEGELAMDELVTLQLAIRDGQPSFLRLMHRLDRVTSGLLLFAASKRALAPLSAAWRNQEVERVYLAVVEGKATFEAERVDAPIAKAVGGGWRFEVSDHGQESSTEISTLSSGSDFSLLKCKLLTGRTHQVRVHLAHLGLPVLGDRLYGSRSDAAPRPLLHATQLALPHPKHGKCLRLESSPPSEFSPFLDLPSPPEGTTETP